MTARLALAVIVSAAVTLVAGVVAAPAVEAQLARDTRFAGLQWTFVRIKYTANTQPGRYRMEYWGEPWAIDSPAAEQNLSRRVKTATSIAVEDPILMTLDDPQLFQHPWIYIVEPGALRLTDSEAANLREFLLRGGTAMLDDFHGPYEWDNLVRELKRVFPDRAIVEVAPPHPIYSCFYKLEKYPQTPGLGSFLSGRTWEKGGFIPHLRAILDERERPMVLINWNTDMGDGWEWSNAEEYPGYFRYTAEAYRMGINEVIYVLTH